MIDLFKLHDNTEDRGPYSWIVVDGPEVFLNFELLIDKIKEKSNWSVKTLSKEVSKEIGCSTSMLYDIFRGKTRWISLALIKQLLTVLREFGEREEASKLKRKFLDSIEFLKSAPRSSVEIKAVKTLSSELAEFCGIHAADGSLNVQVSIESKSKRKIAEIKKKLNKEFSGLRISKIGTKAKNIEVKGNKYIIFFNVTSRTQTKIFNFLNKHDINFSLSYKLEFVDSDKNSMEHLRKVVFTLFRYQIKIKSKKKEGGGYFVHFSNKIMGRYLKNLFNFPVGKKSDVVDAPRLIKSAPFSTQKAFARGVIQFDGSVKRNGNVGLSTNSKHLLDFFLSVIKRDILNGAMWARKERKKELTFESPPSKQWLTYFIKNTLKHQRLHEHIYGFTEQVNSIDATIKIFNTVFPSNNRSTLPFSKLIKKVSKLKEFTRYQISDMLNTHYKSLSVMLEVLKNAKIIKIDPTEMLDRFKGKSDKITFNSNIKKWRIPLLQGDKR